MPMLFFLGQHGAFPAVGGRLKVGEKLFAFLIQRGRHHSPGLEAPSPSPPNALMATPKRRVRSQERQPCWLKPVLSRWRCFRAFTCLLWCVLLHPRQTSMGRRGWQAFEVPKGGSM